MVAVYIALCLVVGYIFGCFSTAYVVGKLNNIDIREHGSQNAGTTNAMRTLGKKAGIVVFLGDCIKAVLAMLIMFIALHNVLDIEIIKLAAGFGAVLGHNFPFWLNFKGGKGIAVTGAVIIAFSLPEHWVLFAVALAAFILITKITKYVSVASMAVVTIFLAYNAIIFKDDKNYLIIVCITLLFTLSGFFMHRANIKRLLNGTENKIGQNKNKNVNNQNGMNNMQNMNNNMMQNGMNNMQNMNNNMMQNGMNNMLNNNTANLYDTDYMNQIKSNKVKNNTDNSDDFYKAYDSCDTIDQTRELDETELNENYSDNYYNQM